MYVDYDFYSNNYGGNVLQDEFTRLEMQASTIVDYYTFNRIKEADDKVKFAACELIDYLKELEDTGGKEIESEKVGSHSVTYAKNDDTNPIARKQYDIVKKYLGYTKLMYRGVD